jgi:hypothetical protein
LKTFVVHDWLYTYAGSERVLESILECVPAEKIFALVDFLPRSHRRFLKGIPVTTSFLQRLPLSSTHRRLYLPLMPLAVENLDVSAADLVVSSAAAVAKGVLIHGEQLHLCYCHSPAPLCLGPDQRLSGHERSFRNPEKHPGPGSVP